MAWWRRRWLLCSERRLWHLKFPTYHPLKTILPKDGFCHPGVWCEFLRGKHGVTLKELWLSILTSLETPWKVGARACLCLDFLGVFPPMGCLEEWHLLKKFKGTRIDQKSLQQQTIFRTISRQMEKHRKEKDVKGNMSGKKELYKFLHVLEKLETCRPVQGYTTIQRRPETLHIPLYLGSLQAGSEG